MISAVGTWLANIPWMNVFEFFVDVTLKGVILCVVAGMATVLLQRSSAFTRNVIWAFALVGLVLLPIFSLSSPVWNLSVLPELSEWGTTTYTSEFSKPFQDEIVGPPYTGHKGTAGAITSTGASMTLSLPWYAWTILAWIAGGFLCLGWYLFSRAGVRRIVKRARLAATEWNRLLPGVSEELNLTRKVGLLESEHVKAAITTGILNPVIVLPSASEELNDSRRRLILSHELAHVKRWDALTEVFTLLVTVVYWFNPLVWFAVKQLRIERERDCDNAVLGAGAKPSDYAELLMSIAADLGGVARPAWRMSTISQDSNLKDRIMSILSEKINRNRGSRRSALLTGVLVLALALPISTSGLWSVQAGEKSKKEQQAKKEKEEKLKKKQMMDAKAKKMSSEEKTSMVWEKICKQEDSAAARVGTVIKKKNLDAGVKAFYEMKEAGEGEYYFKESEFNTLGYVLLNGGHTKEAITVFELNVKEYPESWNTYDSLGEAYMVAENYEKSAKNYQVALEKNPKSESSKKALMKLKKLKQLNS